MTHRQQQIPESYLCSITHQIMEHPVIDREGNTYEETAILEWLELNQTSPITRNYLDRSHLTINRAVSDAISEFKDKNRVSDTSLNSIQSSPRQSDAPIDIEITQMNLLEEEIFKKDLI